MARRKIYKVKVIKTGFDDITYMMTDLEEAKALVRTMSQQGATARITEEVQDV